MCALVTAATTGMGDPQLLPTGAGLPKPSAAATVGVRKRGVPRAAPARVVTCEGVAVTATAAAVTVAVARTFS